MPLSLRPPSRLIRPARRGETTVVDIRAPVSRFHKRTCSLCADSSVSLGLRTSQVVLQQSIADIPSYILNQIIAVC